MTQLLISKGADVNALNKYKQIPLHIAISSNSHSVVDVLLPMIENVNLPDINNFKLFMDFI